MATPELLSGIFYCGHCGGRMEAQTVHPRGHTYFRYKCARHRKTDACAYVNYQHGERVDAAVIAALDEVLGDLDLLRDSATGSVDRMRADLAAAEKRLDEVAERFLRNMALFERGAIASEEQLAAANQQAADEQRSLTREIERLKDAIEDASTRVAGLTQWNGVKFSDHLRRLEPGPRKALVQQLVSRVEMSEGEAVPTVTLRVSGL